MPSVRCCTKAMRVVTGVTFSGALLLSGCGGDTDPVAPTTTQSVGPTTIVEQTNESKPATATVRVTDMRFSPAELRIAVGDTVVWTFDDSVPHTVQGIGDRAMGINSPIIDKGEWSHTFTTAGTYRYLCTLHPEMRGSITVE
ncbi:cupredoxin family copper-binding protein [Nocardia sp. CNY236]|uniref:cupredoxin domain-containing protein n=1 Tax=Nocardia sp. CNY236 TaxID=1169152 RepID=UPI000684DB77|nr:cupredoxin family copper-binding protein [Nocardia sp. CNY236]